MISAVSDLYVQPQSQSTGGTALDRDAFMQLLIAQMRNQDPTEPTSNEQFIAQLAQFSSLEEMQGVNENLVALAALQQGNALMAQLTDASALIGNNVIYSNELGQEVQGLVESVRFEGGTVMLSVDGTSVPLSAVGAVTGPPTESNSGE
ncbi:MAG: flagellar hook capping FlgD N-terminal domain-containing protein [Planctomycetota bacterium]